MKCPLFLILIYLLICGCTEKVYENKPVYEINVDETVEIYYSTNSCCYYCFSEKQNLSHIEFLEEKSIDSGPDDCAGCNFTKAYVFKAKLDVLNHKSIYTLSKY